MSRPTPMALLMILLTILFTVAGQLLVKRGMMQVGAGPTQMELMPRFLLQTFTNLLVVLGLGSAVVGAVCWTVAVSRTDLSFAYPFMGLAIVLTLALSGVVCGEKVPLQRWMGVIVVCVGLIIASRSQ